LTGHDDSINVIAISPDGKRLVSGGADNNIIVWDMNTGNKLKQFTGHYEGVLALAISPDGYTLVSGGGDNLIKIWRVQD
jgi:WD40 repeat protein